MARGAWLKATVPAITIVNAIPFHGDKVMRLEELDMFGLLNEEDKDVGNGAMAYNPAILEAIQTGGRIEVG